MRPQFRVASALCVTLALRITSASRIAPASAPGRIHPSGQIECLLPAESLLGLFPAYMHLQKDVDHFARSCRPFFNSVHKSLTVNTVNHTAIG